MSQDFYAAIVQNFDVDAASEVAGRALAEIVQENPHAKTRIVQLLTGLNTQAGKVRAISFMQNSFVPSENDDGATLAAVIEFSRDPDKVVRRAATTFLAGEASHEEVRIRLQELFSDDDTDVRNSALVAAPKMVTPITAQSSGVLFSVIPDETRRDEALQILDELERAVNVIMDIGSLTDAQASVADELVLPRIAELRLLLSGTATTEHEVANRRKQGLVTASGLATGAKALVLATTTLGSADEAVETVKAAANSALPAIIDLIQKVMS